MLPLGTPLDLPTAIQALIIGDNHEALRVAGALYDRGLWMPAIRPPTVPVRTGRIRISLRRGLSPAVLSSFVSALKGVAA